MLSEDGQLWGKSSTEGAMLNKKEPTLVTLGSIDLLITKANLA
jgi:hypothetical protein